MVGIGRGFSAADCLGDAPDVVRRVASRLDGQVDSPAAEARELVAHVTRRRIGDLILTTVDAAAAERLAAALGRRLDGEPLQHILGTVGFRTIELAVGPGAFIPRPETEVMVQAALDELAQLAVPAPLVVDLCTGTGAIACAIATESPRARVHAVELSEDALVFAARNCAAHGVELHPGDMADALPTLDGTVDVVISNPPYIPLTVWESVPEQVRDHDPHLALFSGEDGLAAMRVVSAVAQRLLRPGGLVLAEHAEVQHEAVVDLFSTDGWVGAADHRDLTDRWRFVTARRCA